MEKVEIDGIHKIYIHILSGNIEKFTNCFKETWANIPDKHKNILASYWKKNSNLGYCNIELSIYIPNNVYGETSLQGTEVKFSSNYFDEMSEAACRFIIAHELGHCMQAALGIHPSSKYNNWIDISVNIGHCAYADKNDDFWGYTPDHENDADRWAVIWGQDKRTQEVIPLPDQNNDSLIWVDYELLVSYRGMIGIEEKNIKDSYINELLNTVFINLADESGEREKLIWENNND